MSSPSLAPASSGNGPKGTQLGSASPGEMSGTDLPPSHWWDRTFWPRSGDAKDRPDGRNRVASGKSWRRQSVSLELEISSTTATDLHPPTPPKCLLPGRRSFVSPFQSEGTGSRWVGDLWAPGSAGWSLCLNPACAGCLRVGSPRPALTTFVLGLSERGFYFRQATCSKIVVIHPLSPHKHRFC